MLCRSVWRTTQILSTESRDASSRAEPEIQSSNRVEEETDHNYILYKWVCGSTHMHSGVKLLSQKDMILYQNYMKGEMKELRIFTEYLSQVQGTESRRVVQTSEEIFLAEWNEKQPWVQCQQRVGGYRNKGMGDIIIYQKGKKMFEESMLKLSWSILVGMWCLRIG